jgi:putative peptide zinc metalloprotease protein
MNQENSQNQQENKKPPVILSALRRDIELFQGENEADGRQTWVIFDPVSDKYFRLGELNHRLAALLDKSQEMEQFIARVSKNGITATKMDILKLISFLEQSNLLQPSYGATEKKLAKMRLMKRKMLGDRILASYLFFRIPIFQPDRFLTRTVNYIQQIFNRWTMIALVIIAALGYLAVLIRIDKLAEALINSISLQGLMRYSLAVIVIKCIHEFSHAYVAKILGIRVRRMGIAFIVFFPRLYTDLTDAWRLSNRRQRFMMDAAGIISELFIGGGAALVWVNTPPGVTNSIAYYIFAVSIINTILVNGNPFIRYDGYYLLMDITGIDNLQRRSIELIRYNFRKIFLGIPGVPPEKPSGLKKHFMITYGIAAFIYRIFLYTSIILIVYFKFTKVIGIILLILEVHLLIIKPLKNEINIIMKNKKQIKKRNLLWSGTGVAILLLLLILPLPWTISMPGEVKPAVAGIVYVGHSGFLQQLTVEDGAVVTKQQRLFVQSNQFLDWKIEKTKLDKEIVALELDQLASSNATRSRTEVKQQELDATVNKIAELQRQHKLLTVVAPYSGIFVLKNRHLKPGKWLRKGDGIGEIFDPQHQIIEAFVDSNDVEVIQVGDKVTVGLDGEAASYSGIIASVNAVPATMGPSPLLQLFGGPIVCYPSPNNSFQPVTTHYQVIVRLADDRKLHVGRTGTVWVRKYSSVGGSLIRKAIGILQREMSF